MSDMQHFKELCEAARVSDHAPGNPENRLANLGRNYIERLVGMVEQQARKIHIDGRTLGKTTFEECLSIECAGAKRLLAEIEEAAKTGV